MESIVFLERQEKNLKNKLDHLKNEITDLELKVGISAVDFDKEKVDGSTGNNDNLLLTLIEKKIKFENIQAEYIKVKDNINFQYELYKQANNRDYQIYIDKKIYKYSDAKLELKYGLERTRYWQICKKIERQYNLQENKEETVEKIIKKQARKVYQKLILELKGVYTKGELSKKGR